MFIKVEKSNTEMYMLDVERLLQINSLSRTSIDLIFNDASTPATNAVIVIQLTITADTRDEVIKCINTNIVKSAKEFDFQYALWDYNDDSSRCPHITDITVSKKYK
tara:strand:+ start:99 stop:416 length:318 start_codon:yes stop_codon:yes gene_type:complete